MMELQIMQSPLISHSPTSPSFNSYSSGALAEIAVRVVQEFADDDIFSSWKDHPNSEAAVFVENDDGTHNDDDFEFASVCREPDMSPVSADEIFFNGKIKPIYHPFVFNSAPPEYGEKVAVKPARLPLGKLFREERESESTASCSSSEAGDLDGVPSESYCVWTPRASAEASPGLCKKSNSTGSSKRWKFRDLLYRSQSDGKEPFLFFAASGKKHGGGSDGGDGNKENNKAEANDNNKKRNDSKKEGNDSIVEESSPKSKKVGKEGEKRRTFLPYRQDLVGIFSNANGVGRNLRPF